ncbi:MAG: hypothetical protein RLZZ612_1854, partial [Pseudomonadota bacterium]
MAFYTFDSTSGASAKRQTDYL